MARYTAEESKSMEYQGAETFRIEKDGGKAQVVFLYTDENSVDGWSCHRLLVQTTTPTLLTAREARRTMSTSARLAKLVSRFLLVCSFSCSISQPVRL